MTNVSQKSNEKNTDQKRSKTQPCKSSADIPQQRQKSNNQTSKSTYSKLGGKNTCLLCKNGCEPSEDDKCHDCGKNVHLTPPCSYLVSEEVSTESFQPRICQECFSNEKLRIDRIKSNSTKEPWNKSKKAKSGYLNRVFAEKELENEQKKEKSYVLRNGNDISLKSVTIEKK